MNCSVPGLLASYPLLVGVRTWSPPCQRATKAGAVAAFTVGTHSCRPCVPVKHRTATFAAGADAFVNYKTENVGQRCLALTDGRGADRIIEVDLAANIQSDLAALRSDGEIVVYGSGAPEIAVPFFASILKNTRYHFFIVYNLNAADRTSAVNGVSNLLRENKLKHQIAARLPLSSAAQAHRLVESGQAVGNVVLDIS